MMPKVEFAKLKRDFTEAARLWALDRNPYLCIIEQTNAHF